MIPQYSSFFKAVFMVCYDAKKINLLIKRQKDDRNFSMLYTYDEQGMLVGIKKETVRGLVTLQTKRNHLPTEP